MTNTKSEKSRIVFLTMDRLIEAVCPPDGKSNYLEWSVNDETGELVLYEEES